MDVTQQKAYELDPHIAEVYDQTENYTDDIALILRLLDDTGPLRVFEPFCGTGRILIPLAQTGHAVV
jgi:SAM-dependent methyltransferase